MNPPRPFSLSFKAWSHAAYQRRQDLKAFDAIARQEVLRLKRAAMRDWSLALDSRLVLREASDTLQQACAKRVIHHWWVGKGQGKGGGEGWGRRPTRCSRHAPSG
jgi:hypothetical protein